jgi:hypothetical protein
MSTKINGLKEPPKWHRYVEPGEEPDPRALYLLMNMQGDDEWKPRGGYAGECYRTNTIYAVPIYGPIPDGYELVEDGEWVEGAMVWYKNLKGWGTCDRHKLKEDQVYIRPITPTPAERPLLTAASFKGLWWVQNNQTESIFLVTGVHSDCITTSREAVTYDHMRREGYKRSNDGEHWEDC